MDLSSGSDPIEIYTLPQPFSFIEFPGRTAAARSYNPSLAWHKGDLVMAFRVSTMTRCGGRAVDFERHYSGELPPILNAVGFARLDPATMTVREARVLNVDIPEGCAWNLGYEDPRVFSVNGSLSVLVSRRNTRGVFALSIIELDHVLEVRRVIAVEPDFELGQHQKNWNPFVREGRLLFVNSIAPHRIAEVDMDSGTASQVHESPTSLFNALEVGRDIRGGAGYVRSGDRYIGICRTALSGTVNRNDYMSVAYAFESDPPFRVSGRSEPFLLGPAGLGRAPLQMVTGLAEVGDDYLIAFGQDDCDLTIARISSWRLLALITPPD